MKIRDLVEQFGSTVFDLYRSDREVIVLLAGDVREHAVRAIQVGPAAVVIVVDP